MAVPEPILLAPIRFPSDNPTIRFHPDSAGAGTLQTVTLPVRAGIDYYLSGTDDPRENQLDLCRILENCLNSNSNNATERYTVTLSAANIITITAVTANTFTIWWDDALTTVDPTIFGFDVAVVGGPIVATRATKGAWIPTPADGSYSVGKRFDSLLEPVGVGVTTITEDGNSRGYDLSGEDLGERTIGFHLVPRSKILTALADVTAPFGALEHSWKQLGLLSGRQFIFFDDRTVRTQDNGALLKLKNPRKRPWAEMGVSYLKRYEVELDCIQSPDYLWSNEFAGSFNGTTSYVSIPSHYRFNGLAEFTLSFWIYQTTQSSPWAIFGKWTTPAANSFLIQMNPNDEIQAALASSSADTGANVGRTSSANLATGVWNHVVVRYEGAGATNADRLRFWVNGVEMTSRTFAGTIPASLPVVATAMEIGRAGAVGRYFTGLIDEVAMYSDAMDAADIVLLYNAGVKADPMTLPNWANIMGYWPLDGHTRDLSGNSHHGTATALGYSTAV